MKKVVLPAPTAGQENESRDPASGAAPTKGSVGRAASEPETEGSRPGPRPFLPPELMEIVMPSIQVGATAGACGLFVGGLAGVLRSSHPVMFSLASGGQWFALGTSFYASRMGALRLLSDGGQEPTPGTKVKASLAGGGVAGMVGGLLRGPRNILPGAVLCSLLGAGGQAGLNMRAARTGTTGPGKSIWNSKWSPIKSLSDQEYEKMLEEKLLRLEVEIAVIDDHIRQIREAESQEKSRQSSNTGSD